MSHVVTVWTSTGTKEAQGTIPSGTGATLTNGFRYVSIVPVLLPAGNYTIGGFYSSASDPVAIQSLALAASGLTYSGTRNGPGFAFPASDSFGRPLNYFGPNFQFTTAPTPDSGSTWALLLLGVAATFGLNSLLHRRSEARNTERLFGIAQRRCPFEKTADDGIRTRDLRFTKPLLYQLSYVGAERAKITSTGA